MIGYCKAYRAYWVSYYLMGLKGLYFVYRVYGVSFGRIGFIGCHSTYMLDTLYPKT